MPISGSVSAAAPDPAPSGYWTEKRRGLKKWLDEKAPPLAELYEGVLKILHDEKHPAKIRFVAHGVREIINCLPDYVVGSQRSERLDYVDKLDKIHALWVEKGLPFGDSVPMVDPVDGIDVITADDVMPRDLLRMIADLVEDHVNTNKKVEEKVYLLMEFVAPENKEKRRELRPIVRHWVAVGRWFTSKAHDPKKAVQIDEKELHAQFSVFEDGLGALIGNLFGQTLDTLDDILKKANE